MSREKQIDEMAKDLENHTCMSEFQAEIASQTLYSKGYRKASEVASEIFGKLEIANLVRLTDDYWKIKEQYTEGEE